MVFDVLEVDKAGVEPTTVDHAVPEHPVAPFSLLAGRWNADEIRDMQLLTLKLPLFVSLFDEIDGGHHEQNQRQDPDISCLPPLEVGEDVGEDHAEAGNPIADENFWRQ